MKCSADGCVREKHRKLFCDYHHYRNKRYGSPFAEIERRLVRGTVEERFWAKVQRGEGDDACWTWTASRNRQEYGLFTMSRGTGRWKTIVAHRVAWELANGPILDGFQVCHKCDNPPCVRNDGMHSHLWLGSPAENSADMVRKQRSATGERNWQHLHPELVLRGSRSGKARLTDEQVREIRSQHMRGNNMTAQLARQYGVGETTVFNVVHNLTWRHVVIGGA